LFFDCLIFNQKQKFLVDSGSDLTCISEETCKNLKIQPQIKSSIKVKQIVSTTHTLGCIKINLTIGKLTKTIKIHVLPGSFKFLLLGMDFLPSFNLIFNFNLLELTQNNYKSTTQINNSKNTYMKTCYNVNTIAGKLNCTKTITNKPNTIDSPDYEIKKLYKSLQFDPSLSSNQKLELNKLITEHLYIFSNNKFDIGLIELEKHRINLTNDTPIYQKPYRASPKDNTEIQSQIDELLSRNIIERSFSPYAAPVTLAEKKNEGKTRLCIDYRKLNAVTIPDRQPIPRIDFLLDHFANAKYFTTLDITHAYHHIMIEPSDIEKTAFVTSSGHYQFKRMPFGLKNAPMCFQRILQRIIAKYQLTNTLNYFDDIIIYSDTFENHIFHLTKVFKALKLENIKLKFKKCDFGKSS